MIRLALAVVACLVTTSPVRSAEPSGFTYQGFLTEQGAPANGVYDLRFTLYSDDSFSEIGALETVLKEDIAVTNGLFTVHLGFNDSLFQAERRWLGIFVRPAGSVALHTPLLPRQEITPAPFATRALSVVPNGLPSGQYGNAVQFGNAGNSFAGDGGGLTNINAASLGGIPATRFWSLGGNAGTSAETDFIGTTDLRPVVFKSDNIVSLRLQQGNVIGGAAANSIEPGLAGATIGGGGSDSFAGVPLPNAVGQNFGTIAGGAANTIQALLFSDRFSFIGGGSSNLAYGVASVLGGGINNLAGGSWSAVVGGLANTNTSFGSFIGGGSHNKIGTPSSVIVGGDFNTTQMDGIRAFIGSGEGNAVLSDRGVIVGGLLNRIEGTAGAIGGGDRNSVTAEHGTVAGGHTNSVTAPRGFVGGGWQNLAGGGSAVVGGGQLNSATGANAAIAGGFANQAGGAFSAIAGGQGNAATSDGASVGGGEFNQATGAYATIPGGRSNTAGTDSFAAGTQAKATHTGAFVWADASGADLTTVADNSVTLRAAGGYRLFSNAGASAGVALAPDGTAWAVISDRNVKKDFAPVDPSGVLEKLAALPIARWHYRWEDSTATPHIGPMAQDFKAAFYPGRDDTSITTLEADGVALAAIQGLNEKVDVRSQESGVRIQKLEEKLNQKDTEVRKLKNELSEIKQLLESLIKNGTQP